MIVQPETTRLQRRRVQARPGIKLASSLFAVVAAIQFSAPVRAADGAVPPASAAATGTAWAASVHASLAAQTQIVPPAAHSVTSWARAVEARLALHAHRAALAGRSALAWSESGMASWYGGGHAGHRTSGGNRFDPMQLTCAHPTLPLGTKVLVTSDTTGRSVVVTVNDRGPFGGRIVDLSRAAAARIGMLGSGTASVTLQQASPEAIEVARADDADTSEQAIAAAGADESPVSPPRRGRPHMHRADP